MIKYVKCDVELKNMVDMNYEFQTEILNDDDCKILSSKLAAINNDVRFSILKILRDYQKVTSNQFQTPLYSREINILLTGFNINITPQMLGQHLKILVEAGILSEVIVKKEIPNKVGKRNVKAYVLKEDAFEDIFLDINFFADELLAFFDLYDVNKRFNNRKCCTLTVFNGKDKGKTFKINRNECAFVGRKGEKDLSHIASRKIILDNSYVTVSNVSKPHLKVFYEDNEWYILDDSSSNGTYLGDTLVLPGVKTPLRNNSFLKLSNGRGGIVFYCSF